MDPIETTQIHGEKYAEIFRQIDGNYCFVCFHCTEYFRSADTILEHIENVHWPPMTVKTETDIDTIYAIESVGASQCDDNTDFDGFVEDDKATTTDIKLTCDYCNEQTVDIPSMESHMFKHYADDQPFSCDRCHQTFNLKHLLDGHRRVVHGIITDVGRGQLTMCNVCGQRFPYRTLGHGKELTSPYECNRCNLQLHNENAHIRLKHMNELRPIPYKCAKCKKSFDQICLLTDHVREVHTNEQSFCEKPVHSQLYGHLSDVHENSAYQCTDCGQISKYPRCMRASCLKQKQQQHTEKYKVVEHKTYPKTNKCSDCGKEYYRVECFEEHRKLANCTAKLECSYCHGLFKNKKSLQNHIADSHSLTSFQCRHCTATFEKKHQRHHHERKHKAGQL